MAGRTNGDFNYFDVFRISAAITEEIFAWFSKRRGSVWNKQTGKVKG